MNKVAASVVLLLASLAANAQQQPAPVNSATQQPPISHGWLDHPRLATWSIGRVATDENTHRQFFEAIGTGVLIGIDEHTGYLVTAKHVFYDPAINWHPSEVRLRFAWQEDRSVFDEMGVTLTLRDVSGKDLWKSPDDGSDLAAIMPPNDLKTKVAEAVFSNEFSTDDDLFQGASTIVLGYPGVIGNEYLIRAIVRQGIVAWTNPVDPLKNVFLVDANLYPGNSGSPVFRVPTGLTRGGAFAAGRRVAFLGIVSKGPIQDELVTADGKPISFAESPGKSPAPMRVRVIGVGGIGVIEPASKVLLLVQSFRDKK
jgi:S1-C subfamily serine protease